jgi:hypothetical protein
MAFDGVCEIRRIAMNADSGRVQLDLKATDGTFDWSWFLCKQPANREALAIGLAAITSNRNVTAYIENVGPWAEISIVGLAR